MTINDDSVLGAGLYYLKLGAFLGGRYTAINLPHTIRPMGKGLEPDFKICTLCHTDPRAQNQKPAVGSNDCRLYRTVILYLRELSEACPRVYRPYKAQ